MAMIESKLYNPLEVFANRKTINIEKKLKIRDRRWKDNGLLWISLFGHTKLGYFCLKSPKFVYFVHFDQVRRS